jgi:predicted amidophosphoribosyltransferase
MYFSKSVRVNVYFSGRPLHSSQYWPWIKMLPSFIISESMPDLKAPVANIVCPSCGKQNPSGVKFCQECGAKMETAATARLCACGAEVAPGKKFCGECGKAIT